MTQEKIHGSTNWGPRDDGKDTASLNAGRPRTSYLSSFAPNLMLRPFPARLPRHILGILAVFLAACSTGVSVATQTRTPAVAQPAFAMSSEPRELLPDEQVQQVLNRLAFGA